MEIPRIPVQFTGTGDLFAALLLAWLHKHPKDLKLACLKTQSTMQHVLHRTMEHAKTLVPEGHKPTSAQLELRLIQSKTDIENPQLCIEATVL